MGTGDEIGMRFAKRVLDLVIALPLLVVLSPVMLIVALLIRFDSTGPVLFKQTRVGLGQREFTILKFRTMKHRTHIEQEREAVIETGVDPRITRIGRFLRKTSLDELPQLINIIRGEMSLVGPRPVLPEQLRAIPEKYMERFAMKPGVTGLAQVKGRRSLNWLEQLKYDSEYCRNWNFFWDLKIMVQTVWVVITGAGVYGTQEDNWRNYIDKDS